MDNLTINNLINALVVLMTAYIALRTKILDAKTQVSLANQEILVEKTAANTAALADAAKVAENTKRVAEEAARSNAQKIDRVIETGKATHSLVDGTLTPLLRTNMTSLEKIAKLTGDPGDHKAAEDAAAEFAAHAKRESTEAAH